MNPAIYSCLDEGVTFIGSVFKTNYDNFDLNKQILASCDKRKIKLTLNLDMALNTILNSVWPEFKTYVKNDRLVIVGIRTENAYGLICSVSKTEINWGATPVHRLGKGPFATEFALSDWKQIEMFARVEEVANKERLVEILI